MEIQFVEWPEIVERVEGEKLMSKRGLKMPDEGTPVRRIRVWSILVVAAVVLVGASRAGAQTPPPVIFFTDLTGGPNTGGESVSGFSGTYITIYGNNFGSSQGSSTINWNGLNCLRVVPPTGSYTGWGMPYLWYQKIIVQLGAGCTPGTGNFVVSVNGAASTSPTITVNGTNLIGSQFTVQNGNIYCVSTGGNNNNTGKYPNCWHDPSKAHNTMASGDITYLEDGVSVTTEGAYTTALSLTRGPFSPSAGLVAYPGATATIGANGTVHYGIRNPAIGGTPSGWTIAGLNLRGGSCLQLTASTYRIVGNDMSCDGTAPYGGLLITSVTNYSMYGNNIHNVGGSCGSNCKLYHAVYFGDASNHIDFGWNIVDPDPGNTGVAGCRGVQWHVTNASGGQNEFDLHVHDNIIRNSICDGLNLATVNPDLGPVEVFNNVFYHNGKGPDPSGQLSGYACIWANAQNVTPVTPAKIYNNSFYDCGARGQSDGSNGIFSITIPTILTNNVSYSANSSAEPYITSISGACSLLSGNNNDWFGAGVPPCSSNLTGSMNVDPKYTSIKSGAALNNLTPLAGSPLYGAGTTSMFHTYDVTGLISPNPPSIGAYELNGASSIARPNPPTNLTVIVK